MKMLKKLSALAIALLVVSSSVSLYAADAFAHLNVEDAEIIDSTGDQGGNAQPIQLVDGYGVGYSQIDDVVLYKDVDFGENGAKSMTIFFSYGNTDGSTTTLDIMIDDEKSAPVAQYTIGNTGGWDSSAAKEMKQDCTIPAGKHDVYVKFTNTMSGSFTWVSFEEADPAPVAAEVPATDEAPANTVTEAPQTSDAGLAVLAASVAIVGCALTINAKKHN